MIAKRKFAAHSCHAFSVMASNSTDSDDDLFGEGQLVVDESAESDKENEEREIQTPTGNSMSYFL